MGEVSRVSSWVFKTSLPSCWLFRLLASLVHRLSLFVEYKYCYSECIQSYMAPESPDLI
jgi:hypothetical protein